MIVEEKTAAEIAERIIAVVRFGPPSESDGLKAGEYYQVTIDPQRFSPCRQYIRFGSYPGDEIMGWQRADRIYVMAQLGKWPESDKEPLLEWGRSPVLETLQ